MTVREILETLQSQAVTVLQDLAQAETYIQLGAIVAIYLIAYLLTSRLRAGFALVNQRPQSSAHPLRGVLYRIDLLLFPAISLFFLKLGSEISEEVFAHNWVMTAALTVAVLLFYNTMVNKLFAGGLVAQMFKVIGLPLIFLHLVGWLEPISEMLKSVSVQVGNISVSAYGLARVLIFGSLLFWMGRASNNVGKNLIRNQSSLDIRTREVFAKLFEVALFVMIFILLLNVMGINLTALAVFGGALGVGLGFGLQSIASNFISGIIILLDRSLTIGDYVEMEDGRCGFVREFQMRYTTLETYDGKDIMVPNEKFISTSFVNWSHKDPKQRYRVDFSVAYHTDIRSMVEIIKEAVKTHPKVLSGDDYPFELQPDCEIDSFGDSGVNMFVEFWMEGIDDGQNRVGGDLLLLIFETLREHDIHIPFPQREVRILKDHEPAGRGAPARD